MKKIFKSIGFLSLLLFSFYYTEKIAIIMQNKSPIMQSINEVESKYAVEASNATIEGNYIVPGIMGRMINKTKSYVNMTSFGIFNEYYLIFDDIKPSISLDDNKDKVIKSGNKNKKAVALLLENNSTVMNYLEENNIKASLLITEEMYQKNHFFEQINTDSKNYKTVESLLNKNNKNTNICYIKVLDKDFCIKERKYLVEETFSLGSNNFLEAKKKLDSGSIILITKNASLENVKLLIKEIYFRGLNVISLSELINEKK